MRLSAGKRARAEKGRWSAGQWSYQGKSRLAPRSRLRNRFSGNLQTVESFLSLKSLRSISLVGGKETYFQEFSFLQVRNISFLVIWYARGKEKIPNTWKLPSLPGHVLRRKAIRNDHYQTYLKLIVGRGLMVCSVLGTWYCPKIEFNQEKVKVKIPST